MANILKGKPVAEAINQDSISRINILLSHNIIPTLAIIRIGQNKDDISYENNIISKAKQLNINIKSVIFNENVEFDEFYNTLKALNSDSNIHGILLLRPIPDYLNNDLARCSIAESKDVDGCNNLSLLDIFVNNKKGFAPCTAQAAIEILNYYKIDIQGKNVVVVGRSLVVGKPLSMLLLNNNATVTICHTKTNNLKDICKKADIVISATGKMESLDATYFNSKQTVIDVGISWNDTKNKLCGDVLFEDVVDLVENITPVPGGVGSVTTSILLNHVVIACENSIKSN